MKYRSAPSGPGNVLQQREPGPHVRLPRLGHAGQRADARAHVARALGVVGLRHQQVAREALGALAVARVEGLDGDAEAARVAADVVEREQAPVAVEGGVLDALGHHRRRRLLEARDELVRRLGQPLDARLAQDLGVLRRDRGRRGGRCGRPAARTAPRRGRRRSWRRRRRSTSGVNVVDGLLALGLVGDRAERPRVAGDLGPQRGQRRLALRVDEQRRRVVEELVADRALDRPVAQLLAGVEDLLDPHVLDARVAQALEVAGGVGEPVGVVDAQAVDRALADQRQREAVRLLEHLRVLLAHAREVVDVEEAAVAAGLRVEVEELLAQLRVAPVAVGVVGRHVVGDDVEHHAQPGVAARRRPARGTPPRRRAPRRSRSGRRRRSRASSPAAPGRTAAGRGARRPARPGRARARAPARSRSRRPAAGGRWPAAPSSAPQEDHRARRDHELLARRPARSSSARPPGRRWSARAPSARRSGARAA